MSFTLHNFGPAIRFSNKCVSLSRLNQARILMRRFHQKDSMVHVDYEHNITIFTSECRKVCSLEYLILLKNPVVRITQYHLLSNYNQYIYLHVHHRS